MSNDVISHLAHHIFELSQRKDLVFSDIHIEQGQPVMVRRPNGWVDAGYDARVEGGDIVAFLKSFDQTWREKLDQHGHFDATSEIRGVRLRCSAYSIDGGERVSVSVRKFPGHPPTFEETGLPASAAAFTKAPRGMLLVSGPTGSGKTTSLASIIQRINETRAAHIVTIEDPIEYVFQRSQSIISQRQVGKDVATFADGLHGALRQRPDVILIGEIRDADTAQTALRAAESGHFVLASTHARNSAGAIAKILSFFGQDLESMAVAMANSLVGVIAQSLVPTKDNKAVLAAEVLHVNEQNVRKAIAELKFGEITDLLRANKLPQCTYGNLMLAQLVRRHTVSLEAALTHSSDPNELRRLADGA